MLLRPRICESIWSK